MASQKDKAIHLMVYTKLSQREIAKELDVREETVSRWKKDKDFDAKFRTEQDRYLQELTAPAMRTMKELLNAKSEHVRFEAASNILDRTGYKPTDRVDLDSDITLILEDDYGDQDEED